MSWQVDFGRGRAVPTLVVIASYLYALNEAGPTHLVPIEQFYNEAVSGLPDESLLQDLRNWKLRKGVSLSGWLGKGDGGQGRMLTSAPLRPECRRASSPSARTRSC